MDSDKAKSRTEAASAPRPYRSAHDHARARRDSGSDGVGLMTVSAFAAGSGLVCDGLTADRVVRAGRLGHVRRLIPEIPGGPNENQLRD